MEAVVWDGGQTAPEAPCVLFVGRPRALTLFLFIVTPLGNRLYKILPKNVCKHDTCAQLEIALIKNTNWEDLDRLGVTVVCWILFDRSERRT